MKHRFRIGGMTCAVCAGAVERVVSRVKGVRRAAVNLSAATLICDCDDSVDTLAIVRAVEAAGFTASLKRQDDEEQTGKKTLPHLIVSALVLLLLMYLAMGEMWSFPLPDFLRSSYPVPLGALAQCVLSAVVLGIHYGYFVRGAQAVLRKSANMDTLVSLGSGVSFLYSLYRVIFSLVRRSSLSDTHLYFGSAAMILVLVTLGKFLEQRAKNKTASALNALLDLAPKEVSVLRDGKECRVNAQEVAVGDLFLVRPGERIPADGVIVEGFSALDTGTVTGESLPVDVCAGDSVLSGSINLSGALTVRADKRVGESTLAQMIFLVEEAGVTRAPAARLADRIARIFVPTVSALSLLTLAVWWTLTGSFSESVSYAISVLVISCPCALGLATPVAITAALGSCASRAVLVRDAASFDALEKIDVFLLDKTGTVTVGRPSVTDVFSVADETEFLTLAASLESYSEHPLARAVCAFVEGDRVPLTNFEAVFGKGVLATLNGQTLAGGNAAFLEKRGVDLSRLSACVRAAEEEGKSVLYFARDTELLGALAVSDTVKDTAPDAVRQLKARQKRVILLTGDRRTSAEAIAQTCGIDEVIAEILPQEKAEVVRRLRSEGLRVAMVGDGINDAPALASADLGISLAGATDIAQNAADVILLSSDLSTLEKLLAYARRVGRVIRQNLFWAFFYNVCAIPVAAGALAGLGVHFNPMIAAACMSVSSLFVVINALRLYQKKENV